MPTDEHQLVAAARSGDEKALAGLIEQHQDRIFRFALKMCGHREDAEDVLQDTLLAVARTIRDYRGSASLPTWLYTIARSFCVKKRRRSKFAPAHEHEPSLGHDTTPEIERIADPGRGPDEAASSRQIQAALEAAIQSLEPRQREVLLLRDVEGLKASEVAEVLGIGVAAVKSRLHRARLRLRELVAPTLGVVEPAPLADGVCPDILNVYSRHVEGEISAERCAEMEEHLAACDRCRTTCDSLKQTLAFCSQLPAARLPAEVQESVRTALRNFLRAPS